MVASARGVVRIEEEEVSRAQKVHLAAAAEEETNRDERVACEEELVKLGARVDLPAKDLREMGQLRAAVRSIYMHQALDQTKQIKAWMAGHTTSS